ncbi:MAG: DUF1592 domain-containing protein [Acidobacteria bacterium]|nr:DUF1592 domain-containing protein [Acidobacteriota bacterium]
MLRPLAGIVAATSLLCAQSVVTPSSADTLLKRNCSGCHNDRLKSGSFSLNGVEAGQVPNDPRSWEKILRKVRTGEMPPVGLPRPDAATMNGFVHWMEGQLDKNALAKPNPGTPAIHRLNRAEYTNAIRDLFALDLDHGSSLPADDSGYGFDNIGDVLTVSPLHMEKYLATARRVTRLAIGTAKASPAIERYNVPRGQTNNDLEALPPNVRSGILVRRYFPVDAEYSILVRVRGNPAPNVPAPQLDIRLDGKRIQLIEVNIDTAEEKQYTRNQEVRLKITAGMHEVGAGFLNEYARMEGGVVSARRGFPAPQFTPVSIEYLQVGGPFQVTGPGETESRKRVFQCRPGEGEAEEPCARKILSTLARRAYRRPVTAADIDPLMRLFASGRKDGGSFDAGIELGLRAMLVSPNFLYRLEHSPKGSSPGSAHRVSDLELASRLSFFLWSSIPDEELLKLAEQNKLRPALAAQVKRMLADGKSKALVDNFAGQWLHLRNVRDWKPDPDKYKEFDEPLRIALQKESEMFFDYIVREDRSVLDFLSADYTFVNDRLARHYGLSGVRGGYFRRVALNDPNRGGILTQGAILTVTSYPTRTSPVLRGKWILENVLGAPPPPPPPDVPTLEDKADFSAKGLRAALEKHRANAACASCHSRLDPLGFSLENYDAVGKFRAQEGGAEIDASGAMPNGSIVRGPGDLKKILLERQDDFVECIAEKMLTYAIGRGLQHFDLPAVRQIRRETAKNEYRFSALALAIVNSVPFQMRRTPDK